MPITREADYPAEYAQLANAFNECADGYDVQAVLNAALQLVAASIGATCKARVCSLEDAQAYTEHVCGIILQEVTNNWSRQPQPGDVEVKAS